MSDARLRELERAWRASGGAAEREAYLRALRRTRPERTWLVYRTPYEDPSCKGVVELPDESVLAWFQRGWEAARSWKLPESDDVWARKSVAMDHAYAWIDAELGGSVYGLGSIFGEAAAQPLDAPQTWAELAELLKEHLYVEGGPPLVEEPTLRVLTDDDEIDLAYYLFPQSLADLAPERTAYLLHDDWKLPTTAAARSDFNAGLELPEIEPRGEGEGRLYLVDMTIREGAYLSDLGADEATRTLEGVRVPDLARYLRGAVVSATHWPTVFFGLRTALGERERTLKQALARCLEHDTEWLAEVGQEASTFAESREQLALAWPQREPEPERAGWRKEPKPSRKTDSKHLLQLCRWDRWKYDRWLVFDDLWASAHPDLARSLLRYGADWDPFA